MKGKSLIMEKTLKKLKTNLTKRLIWNPDEYDNITQVTLNANKIWLPDIV